MSVATTNRSVCWICFGLSLLALVAALASAALGSSSIAGPAVVVLFTALAMAFMSHAALRGVAFTIWVLAFVAASMFYPAAFGTWFGRDLKILIVPLIQVIMFGMGTTLSVQDFTRVLALPRPVCVGMVPRTGWTGPCRSSRWRGSV